MIELLQQLPNAHTVSFSVLTFHKLVFEERVKLNCVYCHNYNRKCTCPPRLDHIDFRKALSEYSNFAAVIYKQSIAASVTDIDRRISTQKLSEFLYSAEEVLWENGYPLAMTFTGGSCKVCDKCNGRTHAKGCRIPIEAMGINVVRTMNNVRVPIIFPPKHFFYRVGLIVW